MRVNQLVGAGLLVWGGVVAAACGDDPAHGAGRDGGAGAAGEAARASGGSEGEVGGGSAGGETSAGGVPTDGGSRSCLATPDDDRPDDYLAEMKSGTRLEVRYFAAEGMPDVFAGFYDTELEQWCDFMLASDDQLRCLPRSSAQVASPGYADAGCSERVVTLSPGCASATGYLRNALECSDKAEVRALEPYSGAPHVGAPDNCVPGDSAAPANSYVAGAEVAPTNFVAGKLVDLPGVCRAGLRLIEAEDGARAPREVFDIASGAGCDAESEGCQPARRAYEEPTLFSDDACETEATESYATWLNAASCAPPDFVRPLQASFDHWYRPGPLATSDLYSNLGMCEPALDKPWIGSIYELGEAVPLSELAPVQTGLQGSGALRAVVRLEAGTPLLAPGGWDRRLHDSETDQDCYLRELTDGSWRCVTSPIVSGNPIVDEFNDSECTVPLRRCQGDGCPGTLIYDEAIDENACSSERQATALWRIDAPATAYYRESPGFPCYEGGSAQPDMWTVESVAPAALAEATLETAE